MVKFPLPQPKDDDERFMVEALKEALKAYEEKEVPIGAVLVQEGRILARGHNQVELLNDATAHGEMLAMTAGAAKLENWRLSDTTLYTTLEPCVMCLGAALLSRVSRIVWAAPDKRHGALGSWVNLLDKPHPTHSLTIKGGVLEEAAASLMVTFFRERRAQGENEEFE